MNSLTVKNAAKINLALDVTAILPNGYHNIESIFQTVGIYDKTTVELTENCITVSCDTPDNFKNSDIIPCNEKNIAYKAAKLFFEVNELDCGCSIHIVKNIPSQAGMGGGSSDAAAVLYILNKLTDKQLSTDKLAEIGRKIGADVPFFLTGGTAYVSGIGEKITQISDYSGKILVIAKGTEGVSTAEAYRNIDNLVNPIHPQTEKLLQAINSSADNAYNYFGNIFEQAVKLNSVTEIKDAMTENHALSALMTGSGSAVFGLFDSIRTAEKCSEILAEKGFYTEICQTVNQSFIEIKK